MKTLTKITSVIASAALALGCFTGCDSQKENGTIKIGVLVADVSGEEALGFKNYYENYIAKNYDVELTYTEQLTNSAGEKAAIEKFAAQGMDAIISFSDSDRSIQLETCANNKMYYAVASGMMDDENFEKYKSNEYFVGQIGPNMETEYETGVNLGKHFKDTGAKKVAIYGAFIPNPMHVYRTAGILTGLGATYGGASDKDAIVGQIFGDQGVDLSKVNSPDVEVVSYFQGYGDTTTDELNAAIQAAPDALLSAGMASTFFTQQLKAAGISFGDIDSFTPSNGENMKSGTLVYLAGKYSSSIGPIFAALVDAVQGHAIRDGSDAISFSQDFLVATNSEEFDKYYNADNGDTPIFSKEVLDTVIGDNVSYNDFKAFVEADRG